MDARTQYRKIEINMYIHRFIEKHRRYFGEPECEILERGIREITGDAEPLVPDSMLNAGVSAATIGSASGVGRSSGRSYSGDGYSLKHGERLEMEYNGRIHKAQIVDGAWLTENGTVCYSPSAAANDVARTKTGEKTQLNGLLYWRVFRDGRWIALRELAGKKRPIKIFKDEDF